MPIRGLSLVSIFSSRISRVILVLFFFLCLDADLVTAKSKFIRVAVLKEADRFVLGVDGRYSLLAFTTGDRLDVGVRMLPEMVTLDNGKIRIGRRVFDAPRLVVEPRAESSLRVNDSHFRGMLVIINNGATLTVVNFVELEQYIKGVLRHEISDKWPLAVMQAQAVATRTYALYSMEQYAARDYDVTNDVYSQVYGGKGSERYVTNLAVNKTQGEVLTYNGKIFPAFFHSNSGGVIEDAAELWDIALPPLKGGFASPYSVDAPHYNWRRNYRLKDIQDLLNKKGYPMGAIKNIRVKEVNSSKRVRKLEIEDRNGKILLIEGKVFRDIIGPNVLKSNMYEVKMRGYYVDFIGHGWGHGVGMCQWGAYNMARQDFSYKQILQFYYPGAKLQRFTDTD